MRETILSPVTIGKVEGTTLVAEGKAAALKPTAVYLPPNHKAKAKVNVILWLHGYYVSGVSDLLAPAAAKNSTNLRESVRAAGKDFVLIAPWLGYQDHAGQGTLTWGEQGKGNGVQAFLEDTLAALARYQEDPISKVGRVAGGVVGALPEVAATALDVVRHAPKKTVQHDVAVLKQNWPAVPTLEIDNLIIASHSAGGGLMRQAAGALGTLKPKLKQCWGFDCLYGSGRTWARWAADEGADLYFYYGTGTQPAAFGDVLGFWKEIYGTPKAPKSGPLTKRVRLAPAVNGTGVEIDAVAFQSMDEIKNKATPGTRYEIVRQATDPFIDNETRYWNDILPSLKGHFATVTDLLKPRIEQSGI